ncbi:conserved hypothetical protein [Theileria orientalis strain Shintoku]|uniref:Uncharacterized protein n=1 Tax=Theileria orientalis strain Shintoku TaxID=869250 RepID=J4DNH7_THEOR|nr:conserved hypothetical protein [Theileria orientalis strain Shintoku]BAM38979.1 conserved hypothetical protein [Theileria orientalis strain Shintoku]|eukprot:XP_009689280.1 conserved hypothetical protein [Theileria orientalis strain Shintoku]
MNIGLLSWCKILSLVLLCRLYVVACDHSGSALHSSHSQSNSAETDVEFDTQRGKKYTKKVKKPPDKISRSSDDGFQDPFLRLFVLDISNTNDTEYTKYKYKDDHHVFIAKGPFLVMAIRRGFTFLWEPTTSRYPNVVVLYPKENEKRIMRLFYPGENSGFTDPEVQPKPVKPQLLRGFVEQKKQMKRYSVQTVSVDGPKSSLKTKKVARHEDDGVYESDPEPATDIELQLTDEPNPQGYQNVQPQLRQLSHPIAKFPPPEPLPPRYQQPQFQAPFVPSPSLQVQPQLSLFPPQPLSNIFVHLNINDRRSTNILHYYRDYNDNAEVFSLEHPYVFDLVVRGNELIWDPDGKYPYEVRVFHLANGGVSLRAFFPFDEPKITPQGPHHPQSPHPLHHVKQNFKQVPQIPPEQLPTIPQFQEAPQVPPEHLPVVPEIHEPPKVPPELLPVVPEIQEAPQEKPDPHKLIPEEYKLLDPQPQHVAQPVPQSVETSEKSLMKKDGMLVMLDINDKWSDEYVEYIWDDAMKADVFVARQPYLLGTIVYGNDVLWRKRDGNYPYAVSIAKGSNGLPLMRVYFPGAQPACTQPSKTIHGNLVKLDINDKWTDEYVEYIWVQSRNADVFVARPQYLLGTIVDRNKVLWRKSEGNYPYAVAIFNPGTDQSFLRMYFSGPKYQPQAQQGPQTPKIAANDQLDSKIQVFDQQVQA